MIDLLLRTAAAAAAVAVVGAALGLVRAHARAEAPPSPPTPALSPLPLESPPTHRGFLWWPAAQGPRNEGRAVAHGGGPGIGLARVIPPPPRVTPPRRAHAWADAEDAYASLDRGW